MAADFNEPDGGAAALLEDDERAGGAVVIPYQSIPPYYLAQCFGIRCASPFAGECDETRRLAFLASRLRTAGTPIQSWKLMLATEQRRVD